MKTAAKVGIGVGVAALLLAAGGASADGGGGGGGGNGGGNMGVRKTRLWKKLESIPELDPTQRYFLMLTAYGEGGYNPAAHNGTASERAASSSALDNNPKIAAWAQGCGVPLDRLRTGSWGTFQRLAPYLSYDAFEIFGGGGCPFADPTRAPVDLNFQIVSAIETARDLQQYGGWQAHQSVGNLRLGWANPSFMGYLTDHADRLAKYRGHATHESLPPGIVDAMIRPFPGNPAQIYQRLQQQGPP